MQLVGASGPLTTWNFTDSSDYVISDESKLEYSNNSVRLRAQNYPTDANTLALYHFDDNSGSSATDQSGNNNNLALSNTAWGSGALNSALSFGSNAARAIAPDSPTLSVSQANTLEAWTKLNDPLSPNAPRIQSVIDKGAYKLYYDNETGKVTYELENSSASAWTQRAGNDIGGSWDLNGKTAVKSSAVIGTNLFVGTGEATGDAEVWRWNGTSWTQIGGDGLNASWTNFSHEEVGSMTTDGTNLFVGLGITTGDAEVWRWNGTSWTQIGGDGLNSGWAVNTYEGVYSLTAIGSTIFAGLGNNANDAEVWRWNGTSWTQIGGDGLNSGWSGSQIVSSMATDGTNLFVGVSHIGTSGAAEVWRWNGTSWTQIGGDGINSSWSASTFSEVPSLFFQNGSLFASLGASSANVYHGEVWRWNGTSWTRLAGNNLGFPANTYEAVYTITGDGTNIYVGTGLSSADGDVWRWNGTSWTQIGGDGLNSGWTTGIRVYSLTWYDNRLIADSSFSGAGDQMFSWDGSSWERIGGLYFNGSWGFTGSTAVRAMTTAGGKLYAGLSASGVNGGASVWEYSGATWQLIGAPGLNSAWGAGNYRGVASMTSINGDVYVGLNGPQNSDGEVWRWNGTSWTQIGGDGLNDGWNTPVLGVSALVAYDDILYAGIGSSGNNGDVWKFEGDSWTRIGGGGLNGGWNSSYRYVSSLAIYQGDLVAGTLGSALGSGDVWRWNGTSWTQIGGDGLNSGWNFSSINNSEVNSLFVSQGKLYAGIGSQTVGDAAVWEYNGSSWSKVGGDSVNNSWGTNTYESVQALEEYNGELYVGLGVSGSNGEVWKYNGTSWTQIGGDGLNSGWSNIVESVRSLAVYQGRIYAGTGDTVNVDAAVYSYGDNGFLQSNTTSFNTDWRHLAASYDGATMRLYINGSLQSSTNKALSMPDTATNLYIGGSKATQYFSGGIDEVRISNVARNSFTTKPYTTDRVAIRLAEAVHKNGIASWDGFSATENTEGGQATYRLSIDGGTTWRYWDGSSWASSNGLSQANSVSIVDDNISELPVTSGGIMWQAILQGDGDQRVTLSTVELSATPDTTPPAANANNIVMKTAQAGAEIEENAWTNATTPYFSWSPANDSQSPIRGYCLYLGTDDTADPEQTKGPHLGTSPINEASTCPYIVGSTELVTATVGVLANPLTSSNSPYYLKIKALDNALNIYDGESESFAFKYDNTPPTNPLFVSTPSQFVSNKQVTVTWPTADANAAKDDHSLVAGLQYKIGPNGTWYGDAHTGAQDSSDLLINDGSYQTVDPPDFDALVDGANTIYFRTYDNAGNVTPTFVTGVIKINTVSPTSPLNVTASPEINSNNSFAFSWSPPANLNVPANSLRYCYTVNTLPSSNTCNFTPRGVTSLPAGPYATQPGENTFYVVAEDEAGNINYVTYGQTTFTANTSAPGIPRNIDIADISVKSTSNWRLALSWDEPTNIGAGVATYRIMRSTNGTSYSNIASTSGTSYVDGSLQSVKYYYKVRACDSANNCGVETNPIEAIPTGKYTTPAELVSQPRVTDISTRKATISWSTDRASDSRIQYGLKSGTYFSTEAAISAQVTDHSVSLNNLTAGTTYYYKARWTDSDGNIGTSTEYNFTTAPAPIIKEATARTTLTTATVAFTSKDAARVKIYYGRSEGFGGVKELNTSRSESTYTVELSELEDGTKYFYKINTFDSDNNEYEGNVYSFTTPPRPRISNVRFQPVENQPSSTQRVTWTTNVPSTSEVSYGVGNLAKTVSDSKTTTQHDVVISGLNDDSTYQLIARSRDENGNLAQSDIQIFRTALDTRPPQISDVQVEVSIRGTGTEARGQVVVSWKTDEPSTSQVAYGEGSTGQLSATTSEDTKLTTEHVMVISDLSTSRVYQVEPRSFDKARNASSGERQIAIVGRASENVLSIIFNALRNIFGISS